MLAQKSCCLNWASLSWWKTALPVPATLVGTQAAASAAPDGYTLLVGGLANMAFNGGLSQGDPRYDAVKDFTAIGLVGSFAYALVGRKDLAQSSRS